MQPSPAAAVHFPSSCLGSRFAFVLALFLAYALALVLPLVVSLVVLSGFATGAAAGDYRSGFGFGISVPETWLVLTQSEVAARADVLLGGEEADATSALDAVPPEMRRIVLERIERGELEIFYRREGAIDGFVDNINVMHQSTTFPSTPEQVDQICRLLPAEFSRVFGRPISMDACEVRDMIGRRALYFQFDGAIQGTKSLQYQVEREPGDTIILTATIGATNLPWILGEFEAIVSSIRFD